MSDAREEILSRIENARLGMAKPPIERTYSTKLAASEKEILDLFEERILDYKATFTRTTNIADSIARIAAKSTLNRIVIPPGLPTNWLPGIVDNGLSSDELDAMDAVVTTCEIAIALTGTIVLNHSRSDQGRRAISLLPDTHICVVHANQVVGTVVEAVRSLNPLDHQTWISGPSATSDIELERVEGVHGPRNLHVILGLD
jgi:L-lactate dehydrogenase complex protein LldG